VRYFGGLRFDSEYSSGANKLWDGFAPAHFVLPRVELRREPHSCTLVLNVLREELRPDRIGPVAEQLKRLGLPAESTATGPVTIRDRVDLPDSKGWREAVEHGLELCSGGPLRKIVLARRSDLNLSNPISPWSLLRMLRKESVGVFMFGFEDVDGQTFIGATPERLYQRESRRIKSEAVAGTRPRGSDEDSDRKLADELMASEKDRREHGHVVDRMREAFNLLCDSFEIQTAPRISSFARVQHLVTRGDGKLKSGVDDAAILSALHPSPAVAGTPTDLAVTHLREIEPFDRGWYAGPVGWLGTDSAEFAVAIRSALINKHVLSLFAGAGIVSGSEPSREWTELENKITPYLELFA
jgi:menaquinone-specific isochorismate synthase